MLSSKPSKIYPIKSNSKWHICAVTEEGGVTQYWMHGHGFVSKIQAQQLARKAKAASSLNPEHWKLIFETTYSDWEVIGFAPKAARKGA